MTSKQLKAALKKYAAKQEEANQLRVTLQNEYAHAKQERLAAKEWEEKGAECERKANKCWLYKSGKYWQDHANNAYRLQKFRTLDAEHHEKKLAELEAKLANVLNELAAMLE